MLAKNPTYEVHYSAALNGYVVYLLEKPGAITVRAITKPKKTQIEAEKIKAKYEKDFAAGLLPAYEIQFS